MRNCTDIRPEQFWSLYYSAGHANPTKLGRAVRIYFYAKSTWIQTQTGKIRLKMRSLCDSGVLRKRPIFQAKFLVECTLVFVFCGDVST